MPISKIWEWPIFCADNIFLLGWTGIFRYAFFREFIPFNWDFEHQSHQSAKCRNRWAFVLLFFLIFIIFIYLLFCFYNLAPSRYFWPISTPTSTRIGLLLSFPLKFPAKLIQSSQLCHCFRSFIFVFVSFDFFLISVYSSIETEVQQYIVLFTTTIKKNQNRFKHSAEGLWEVGRRPFFDCRFKLGFHRQEKASRVDVYSTFCLIKELWEVSIGFFMDSLADISAGTLLRPKRTGIWGCHSPLYIREIVLGIIIKNREKLTQL